MARVFVVAREALANDFNMISRIGDMRLTVVLHGVRNLVLYRSWRLNSETGPLLHSSAIDGFSIMLYPECQLNSQFIR